jgi:hypothetical protein
VKRKESATEKATQAYLDSLARPGMFDLLGLRGERVREVAESYIDGCLMDVQRLLEIAWEQGEIGSGGQLQFQWR